MASLSEVRSQETGVRMIIGLKPRVDSLPRQGLMQERENTIPLWVVYSDF